MTVEKQRELLSSPLPLESISLRADSVGKSASGKVYARLLAYKDSRVDMDILDKVFGADGWSLNIHLQEPVGDDKDITVVARLTVRFANGTTVVREGVSSTSEFYGGSIKSAASDALKRAGFLLGIGRELYSFPKIVVELQSGEYYERNGKINIAAKANIPEWRLARKNKKLVVLDHKGNVRWQESK